jgi:phosphate transport system ATP-binding protein
LIQSKVVSARLCDTARVLHKHPTGRLRLGPEPSHDLVHEAKIEVRDLDFWYGEKHALKRVSLDIFANEVTAFLGPSGCGKTTLLRCLNRTNEVVPSSRMQGRILVDGTDIYDRELDPPDVRRRFGWIAQKPNPFPWSIRRNILYGPALHGRLGGRAEGDALVESTLRAVGLWDEVKDRLDDNGEDLSIGQRQRLCIARAIATKPEVLLMDEPCSALDPISTAVIENLIDMLRATFTIVIITHNIQQAARIAQRIAYFHLGEVVEAGDTRDILINPETDLCRDFVTGRFG